MNASQVGGDPVQALVAWSERRGRRPAPEAAGVCEPAPEGRYAYALLKSHEAERARLCAVLHDELASMVVMVRFQLEESLARQHDQTPADSNRIVQEAVGHLREISSVLLGASARLHPRALDDIGLGAAVEGLCREVGEANQGLEVACRVDLRDEDVPYELRIEVFRILEEALANVAAHSGASHAQVSLYRSGAELCALVEDDGCGFDAAITSTSAPVPDATGVGLQAIRWRVEATGGRLLFAPGEVQGTRIGAAWPL
jgi:signal transduction histidine kinase